MGLTRPEGWEHRLATAIEADRCTPFRYGAHDCCLFAARVVDNLTGHDFAAEYRGKYRSARKAQQFLSAAGGLRGIMAATGLPEVPARLARRGDVVLVAIEGQKLLGVVDTTGLQAMAPGMAGLLPVPIKYWLTAWRVG